MAENPDDPRPKPPCSRDDALAVLRRLREAGHVAYFAGGCVRDLLLGLDPKDYDVATDAPPDRVRKIFRNTQAVGAAFGVILVRHDRSVVEVATFRSESNYADGRRPQSVRFTTPAEDASRRDFTINGLFLDPLAEGKAHADELHSPDHPIITSSAHGHIIDYVGGQADLRNRILRAIGDPDVRFAEDYLRLLRAVRFAARFSLRIDPSTDRAIRSHARLLTGISPERVGEELRLMLTPAATRNAAWRLLRDYVLDEIIFRFLLRETPAGTATPHAAATPDLFELISPGSPIPFGFALAAASLAVLLPRAGAPDVRELATRPWRIRIADALRKSLKISNEESNALEGSLAGLEILLRDDEPSVASLKRFLARPTAPLSRELLAALSRAGLHPDRAHHAESRLRELEKTDYAPPPLITGDDLTAAGMHPGPKFKKILDAVYDAQLENRTTTKEQALALARQLYGLAT